MSNLNLTTSPSEELVGMALRGKKREGHWHVKERIEKGPNDSGGNFSVGYIAVHDDGTEAFLKSTDIGLLTRHRHASPLDNITDAFNEQRFERAILEICHENHMDRIVHALDYGEFETTHGGVRDYVFFIIFEKASGDVRKQADRQRREELSWVLNALHNLAVAIQQLHGEKIAHNDVKPSNFLVFDKYLQKLADLGRATSDKQIGPWDSVKYSGDPHYAAPEFWYSTVTFPNFSGKIAFNVRQASDLYMLGSMGFFLTTGESLTPLIVKLLRPEHWPMNWCGSFDDVLPYIRDAFGHAMQFFDAEIPGNASVEETKCVDALRVAITQLSDPDPRLRGHPVNLGGQANRYSVERYVSLFDNLAKRIVLLEKIKS